MTKCFQSQYFQMFMEYKQTFQIPFTRMTQPARQPAADRDDSGRTVRTGRELTSQWKRIGNCGLRTSQSDLVSNSK
jgi:hypothetical protein